MLRTQRNFFRATISAASRFWQPAVLGVTLLALGASAAPAAQARGGEDWPFKCALNGDDANNMVDSMRLIRDDGAPQGYGLELYQGDEFFGYVYPDVDESSDPRFLVVSGTMHVGTLNMHDLQVLAFVARTDEVQSQGGTDLTWRGQPGEFAMSPMNCHAESAQ